MHANTDSSPMGRIQRLPDILINQIAAGEVVERPSSVVKELVENALDAGARRLDILLTDGGITQIQIIDDGHGILAEDLPLAVERHATSKIHAAGDLEAIRTFGFRGEALSSIASVSILHIKSRVVGQPHAWQMTLDFGKTREGLSPAGAPVGTSLTVSQLFERVPARQKFLRSAATEFSHCSRVVKELALGNPQTAFYLHHQGRVVAHYSAPTREGRLQEVLKPSWEPWVVRAETDGLSLEAFLSPPEWLQERGELYLYINQRAVHHRPLLQAVRNAFTQSLGEDHDPSGVLHLGIRFDWVDVNVHPQKWEVRCLGQERIFGWLQALIRKSLPQRPPAPAPVPFLKAPEQAVAGLRVVGQLHGRPYWLCEDAQGLLVVDPARVCEKYHLQANAHGIPMQDLAVPCIVRVPPGLAVGIEVLRQLGLEVEGYADGDLAVKNRPDCLPEEKLADFILEVLRSPHEAHSLLAQAAAVPGPETWLPWVADSLSAGGAYRVSFSELEIFFKR